jgi:hypothetical protein
MELKFDSYVSEHFDAAKVKSSLQALGISSEEYGEYMAEESTCHYLC